MKLRSHSGMNDCISQGSSRSLALYCLGSCETQREAAPPLSCFDPPSVKMLQGP
jgi:hypothetical protein